MSYFYIPWEYQKTGGFLMFSRVIEVEHWLKMVWRIVRGCFLVAHFRPMSPFCVLWKRKETPCSFMLSGDLEKGTLGGNRLMIKIQEKHCWRHWWLCSQTGQISLFSACNYKFSVDKWRYHQLTSFLYIYWMNWNKFSKSI